MNNCDNPIEELNIKSDVILEIVKTIIEKLPNVKMTLDIYYSISKYISTSMESIIEILENEKFEEKRIQKNNYRKFEILNKRNITTNIGLNKFQDNNVEITLNVGIENILINLDNLKEELINSIYFYYSKYARLHYLILKEIDLSYINSNEKLYNKIKSKY